MEAKSDKRTAAFPSIKSSLNQIENDDIRLALRPAEAAKAISVSVRTLHTLIKNNEIKAAKLNRAVFIPIAELESFLDRHMDGGEESND